MEELSFPISNTRCAKCRAVVSFHYSKRGEDGLIYHNTNCLTDICLKCKGPIGNRTFEKLDDKFFHSECFFIIHCLVCSQPVEKCQRSLLKVVDDTVQHISCEPIHCFGCKKRLDIDQFVREWNGSKYHHECTPYCFVCDRTSNLLRKFEDKYKCSDCDPTKCYKCELYIGKLEKKIVGNFFAHQRCCEKCPCGLKRVNPYSYPVRFFALGEIPLIISESVRQTVFTLICANKRTKKLSPDMLRMLITAIFNSDKGTLSNVRERHGIDFLQTCTPDRCIDARCEKCCSEISYTKDDPFMCNVESCKKIYYIAREIKRKCFPEEKMMKRGKNNDHAIWIERLFKKYKDRMTTEQTRVYAELMTLFVIAFLIKRT